MRDTPLASVIISSYNYGRYLGEAIDSALQQRYPHTEVIVVDDGSTDHSRDVLAGYAGRVRAVLKENGGQASALNAGFAVSRGEVVLFLDSDDALLPTAVERAVALLAEPGRGREGGSREAGPGRSPGRSGRMAKVHWPLWAVDGQGQRTGKVMPDTPLCEGDLRETVLRTAPGNDSWPPTSGNAWARWFLEDVLPIPEQEYVTCPDFYLVAFAPFWGRIGRITEPQGVWRIHGANNSWSMPFDQRVSRAAQRAEYTFQALGRHCRRKALAVDLAEWRANSWWHRLDQALWEITSLIPSDARFILVDQEQWEAGTSVAGRRRIPFLEREGQYWGLPPDDAVAISELERLQEEGAGFMVFAWPSFWWLDYYAGLREHLRARFPCLLENDRIIVFAL